MKKLVSPLLIALCTLTYGQQEIAKQKTFSPKLMNVKDIFIITGLDKGQWTLYAANKAREYAPKKAETIIAVIDTFLLKPPTENKSKGQINEFGLIKKYRNNIDNIFKELELISSDQYGSFFCSGFTNLPVHFAVYGDTALSLIVSGVFIDNIYNTLRMTERQRAAKVITTYILPNFKSFTKSFQGKEIKYFGMICVYGTKDFSDDGSFATKPETVAFISPVKFIRRYVAGDLTEEDMINFADIFISGREMGFEYKKIKITLE